MNTTSLTLLERLRNTADEAAWARLVDLYTPVLYALAHRCGLGEHDAADLVQEVFATLVTALPSFQYDRGGKFRGWLRTILLNKLRNRKLREGRMHQALEALAVAEEQPDGTELLREEEFRLHLTRRALELIQVEFTASTWQACWQTVVEGRSTADVARELCLSENAVYVARCRVLRHLRRELGDLLD